MKGLSRYQINFKVGFIFLILTLQLVSCQVQDNENSSEFNSSKVEEEVTKAVWSFHKADTLKSSEMVMDLIWPDCSFLIDGNRISYQDIKKGSKQYMSSLDVFHTEWNDLEVKPLSPELSLSSFIFKDSIVDKEGVVTQSHGPNTFLWQKRGNKWKVLFVDADHYK